MYFLDFDRTTFDADAFTPYLRQKFAGRPVATLGSVAFATAMNDLVIEGTLAFAPGELSQFLYEDAGRFLRDKENGVMLITYGNVALQKAKVESALYGIPRISTIYTNLVRKGEYLAPHIGMYGQSPVFVDDSLEELEIFATKCPSARVFEMRRDGGAGDGRWSVIHTLTQLP